MPEHGRSERVKRSNTWANEFQLEMLGLATAAAAAGDVPEATAPVPATGQERASGDAEEARSYGVGAYESSSLCENDDSGDGLDDDMDGIGLDAFDCDGLAPGQDFSKQLNAYKSARGGTRRQAAASTGAQTTKSQGQSLRKLGVRSADLGVVGSNARKGATGSGKGASTVGMRHTGRDDRATVEQVRPSSLVAAGTVAVHPMFSSRSYPPWPAVRSPWRILISPSNPQDTHTVQLFLWPYGSRPTGPAPRVPSHGVLHQSGVAHASSRPTRGPSLPVMRNNPRHARGVVARIVRSHLLDQ